MIAAWLTAGSDRPGSVRPDRAGHPARRGDQPRADERGPARDGTSRRSPLHPAPARNAGTARPGSPVLIRYADDLLALCHSREQAEQVKARLAAWLAPRGLVFNEDKTRIVHLDDGVDFLGFNVRRYRGKLLIKPSKAAVKRIRARLTAEMRPCAGTTRRWCSSGSTRSSAAGRPTTGMWCPPGCSTSWTTTCGSSPTSGRSSPIHTSRSTGSSPGTSARSTHARRDRWVFGDRDSGAYLLKFAWTKITRHTLVKGWASPDDPALTSYWAARRRRGRPPLDRAGCGSSKGSADAARSAESCCCTPTTSRSTPTNGNSGSQRPARRSATTRSPSTQDPETRTHHRLPTRPRPLPQPPARRSGSGPALLQPRPIASRACLSRLPGKRARPVLRGRGRSNAPPLPDWKPAFYLLEAQGLEPWLVNAKDVKHLPGRPKTDVLDAVWLCKVAERQMLRQLRAPGADPPAAGPDPVPATWSRPHGGEEPGGEAARGRRDQAAVVASDIFGVSGRDDAGRADRRERDPKVLAALARARMRSRSTVSSWRRSPGGSPTTTLSCCAPCWPGSTRSAPTSPRSRPRSRKRSPLSPRRSSGSMRFPGSERPRRT